MTSLHDTIAHVLTEHFAIDTESLTPQATLKDLDLDSLALAELVVILESEHGIEVPDDTDEIDLNSTLGHVVAVLDRQRQAGEGAEPETSSSAAPGTGVGGEGVR